MPLGGFAGTVDASGLGPRSFANSPLLTTTNRGSVITTVPRLVVHARRAGRARSRRVAWRLEELVLAAEDVAHRAVGEDLADRARQEVRAREHANVVGRPWRERDGVGDDDLF